MVEKSTTISSGAAILAIAAIVMSFPALVNQENVYACVDTQIAMHCDKLSSPNEDGLQTRCYFFSEKLNRTSYKVCSSGWLKYEPQIESEKTIDTSNMEQIYLQCVRDKQSSIINRCQIIGKNDTMIVLEYGGE